jgi:hypothetical protein
VSSPVSRSTSSTRRMSASDVRAVSAMASSEGSTGPAAGGAAKRAPSAWVMTMESEWAMMSCISRAMRARSSATARSTSRSRSARRRDDASPIAHALTTASHPVTITNATEGRLAVGASATHAKRAAASGTPARPSARATVESRRTRPAATVAMRTSTASWPTTRSAPVMSCPTQTASIQAPAARGCVRRHASGMARSIVTTIETAASPVVATMPDGEVSAST